MWSRRVGLKGAVHGGSAAVSQRDAKRLSLSRCGRVTTQAPQRSEERSE